MIQADQDSLKKVPEKSSVLHEWAKVTTWHGVDDCARAKTVFGKVIWFVVLLVSFSMMTYQLYCQVAEYAKHEWVTTINEQPADAGGVPLPTIILCNINRLKWSKAQEYEMTLEMIDYLFLTTTSWVMLYDYNAQNYTEKYTEWRKQQNFSFIDIFEHMGPSCEDIIIDNIVGPGICRNPYYSVDHIYTYDYGRCLRVNPKSTVTPVGLEFGWMMLLNVQSWDYVPLFFNNYVSEGLVMQLTYNGNAEQGQWTRLYPATETSVSLQPVQTTVVLQEKAAFNPFALIASEPPCALQGELQFENSSYYSVVTCQTECRYVKFVSSCNCYPFIEVDGYRTCEAEELFDCAAGIMRGNVTVEEQKSYANQMQQKFNECMQSCLPPCYDRYVDTQISIAKFPSERVRNQMQQFINESNLYDTVKIDDVILFNIYFESLQTQVIQSYESISFEDLISQCGGLIGVWAGMSFITVFQAVAYMTKFLKERRQERMNRVANFRPTTSSSNEKKHQIEKPSDLDVPAPPHPF